MEIERDATRAQVARIPLLSDVPTEASSLLTRRNGDLEHNRDSEKDVPYKNIDGRRFKWLFVCILMAFVLAFFDSTLMASSHPVITSYFHASHLAPWLSTVFYLSSTVSQPLYGRISDSVGRRPVLLFAMLLFGVTTAWCAVAPSIGSFIAARAACGAGAGGVIAMSNILMADVIKIQYRGLYQSYLNMAYGVGNGLGAALGSFLCDSLGWRAAFGIQLPFISLFLVLAYLSVPSDLGPSRVALQDGSSRGLRDFDVLGATMLTVTTSALILGINLGGNVLTWSHPIVIVSLITFAVSFCMLILVERKAITPVLPLRFLTTIPIANLMWSNFLGAIAINTALFNFPLLLQAAWQTSPTESGLWLLGPLAAVSASSVFAGVFIKRTGRFKPMLTTGSVLYLVGSVGMSCLTLPGMPKWAILLLNPYTSLAQGFHFPATTVSVLALSPPVDQAVATTTLGLLRNLGAILGVSLSSWVFQNVLLVTLDREVTGSSPIKRRIIDTARKSVGAIKDLDPQHKREVIRAYSQALRITFLTAAVFGIAVMCLVLPVRLSGLDEVEDEMVDDRTNETGAAAEPCR